MGTRRTGDSTGNRWTDFEVAGAAQRSGRATISLARFHGSDDRRRAVLTIMGEVFRAATTVRSAHEWAERVVELHYPDSLGQRRHFAVQALRIYTLQGVPVGWNTALSVLLVGEELVSNLAEGAGAQVWADEIFRSVVGDDPDGAAGRGRSTSPDTVGNGDPVLSPNLDGPSGKWRGEQLRRAG